MAPELGFAISRIDRCANQRHDPAWVEARRRDPAAKLIAIYNDRADIADGHILARTPEPDGEIIFLGLDGNTGPWFAAKAPQPLAHSIDLRSMAVQGLVPPEELGLLAQARSLIHWHETHSFCSRCGAATALTDGGYRRHCEACGADHFPRTDPVVIIVVRSAQGLLLGRQSSWLPGMFSALAGFMEPGETIEDAARREVFEEAGIRVGSIRYVASQPWPFPSSLMIGLIGEALSEDIEIDVKELEQAYWFGADELAAMREERHPEGRRFPTRMAIAHHLVLEALQSV